MPSKDEHLRLASKFSVFLDKVRPLEMDPPQIELAISIAYWRSLHYVDALLADTYVNVHPANDGERFEAMRNDGRIQKLYRPYRNVKDRYSEAMYQARVFTAFDFTDDILADAEEIRRAAERMLGL